MFKTKAKRAERVRYEQSSGIPKIDAEIRGFYAATDIAESLPDPHLLRSQDLVISSRKRIGVLFSKCEPLPSTGQNCTALQGGF